MGDCSDCQAREPGHFQKAPPPKNQLPIRNAWSNWDEIFFGAFLYTHLSKDIENAALLHQGPMLKGKNTRHFLWRPLYTVQSAASHPLTQLGAEYSITYTLVGCLNKAEHLRGCDWFAGRVAGLTEQLTPGRHFETIFTTWQEVPWFSRYAPYFSFFLDSQSGFWKLFHLHLKLLGDYLRAVRECVKITSALSETARN